MSRLLVVDASVVVDLLGRFRPRPIEALLWAPETVLAAPELLQVEVLQALRRLDRAGAIPSGRGDLLDSLRALRIHAYPHAPLLDVAWTLRNRVTAYDGVYVALARALKATLVTRDQRLAKVAGLAVMVETP